MKKPAKQRTPRDTRSVRQILLHISLDISGLVQVTGDLQAQVEEMKRGTDSRFIGLGAQLHFAIQNALNFNRDDLQRLSEAVSKLEPGKSSPDTKRVTPRESQKKSIAKARKATVVIPATELLNEYQAASIIGMSVAYLRADRSRGHVSGATPGPEFLKIGRSVKYRRADIDAWLEKRRVAHKVSGAA